MAERTVVWTRTAIEQRRKILAYWTRRNNSTFYAEKLIKITAERINVITRNPEACPLISFPDTRVASMGHFSIFYKTSGTQIIVTAFWDNRQDPEKLLQSLR